MMRRTDSWLGRAGDSGRRLVMAATIAMSLLALAPRAVKAAYGVGGVCLGDCGATGTVSVSDLVLGVNIALDILPLSACPEFADADSGLVLVDDLVAAVDNALNGCPPATPTPTTGGESTPTATAAGAATPTSTAGGDATATPTVGGNATATATVGAVATPTSTPAGNATATATALAATSTPTAPLADTATPTTTAAPATPTNTAAVEATSTPTSMPAATPTPTVADTLTPTLAPSPTATVAANTATATPAATATPTNVPSTPDLDTVAAAVVPLANSLGAIPQVVSAIVAGLNADGDAALAFAPMADALADLGGIAGTGTKGCPLGGTSTQTGGITNFTLVLEACEIARPGGSVVFDGTISLVINNVITLAGMADVDVDATIKDDTDTVKGTSSADFTAPVTLDLDPTTAQDPCGFNVPVLGRQKIVGVNATVTGELSSTIGPSSVMMTFPAPGVGANVQMIVYEAPDCSVVHFKLTLNGDAEVAQTGGTEASSFMVDFTNFAMVATIEDAFTLVEFDGNASSLCFGGATAVFDTIEPLKLVTGQFCPTDGTIEILNTGTIMYNSNGSVTVDGTTFPSCLDVGGCLG